VPPDASQPAIPSFGAEAGAGAAPATAGLAPSPGGYLDDPVPFTHFRLRFDAAFNDIRPDRAEFLYPKCGCFRTPGVANFDPNAPGPPLPETRINFQVLSGYLEVALGERFSAFVDVPLENLEPEVNHGATGIGDMRAGFKWAFLYTPTQIMTFQGRFYIPTGNPGLGLGVDHLSLEPGLLYRNYLTDKLIFQAQLEDWIPIGGTDFAGNVLNYGAGLSYLLVEEHNWRLLPVFELLGWTVLNGKELDANLNTVFQAGGDTIINCKVGARIQFGHCEHNNFLTNSDLYIGYGRCVTGDAWYRDIVRVEYRIRF
jgi:hypothetical protein